MTMTSLFTVFTVFVGSLTLSAEALGAKGSPAQILSFEGSRSSYQNPLHAEDDSLTLWCAPDNSAITIKAAQFVRLHDKKILPATHSGTKKNVTHKWAHPTINDAGEYACELETQYGKAVHRIHVYAQPIAHPHGTESYDLKDDKENHLLAPSFAVQFEDKVNITCPVVGHPQPAVKWTKDGQALALSSDVELDGNTVVINKATPDVGGVYTCTAINEFNANGKTSKKMLVVDKLVTVKGEYAWIWPLIVIIVIIALLVLIIALCECRRKRQEGRLTQYEVQE